jgi:hypothetical protein
LIEPTNFGIDRFTRGQYDVFTHQPLPKLWVNQVGGVPIQLGEIWDGWWQI